mgnify:CR=1 FL=1
MEFWCSSFYFLFSQIITGIFLAMFYNPSSALAYSVIMELNNEIYYGWWVRYLHANGASFLFLSVYLHMFRGIYYGSFTYPRQLLWMSGILLLILMIITAFLGYILPWGQMSFWAAMVITSLLGAIPLIGSDLIFLLWGGYAIFFFIFLFSILHCFPFTPYYVLKDLYSLLLVLIFFFLILSISPDLFNHPVIMNMQIFCQHLLILYLNDICCFSTQFWDRYK